MDETATVLNYAVAVRARAAGEAGVLATSASQVA
jgi:hypothetical protein